jgi:DNA-binding transcriptional LysR family regulator
MQFESLKIFCDVVRSASFSRGAMENGISQSSASQAVQHLEERLGLKLIDRSKRPLVLTPPGKVYFEGCRELVDRYFELEKRVKGVDDNATVAGTVGVAAIYSGLHCMTQYVKTFQERYARASVKLEYLHPARVIERVTSGEAELGLLSFPKKWPDLNVQTWREEEMVLTVHPTHRFAKRSKVAVSELEGEPFIAFDTDLSIRRAIDKFLRKHSVQVDVVLAFDNIENIKRAIEVPAGVSILPEPSLVQEIHAGTLVAIPIEGRDPGDRLTRPLAIIHRRQSCLEPAASKFLELLISQEVGCSRPAGSRPNRRLSRPPGPNCCAKTAGSVTPQVPPPQSNPALPATVRD